MAQQTLKTVTWHKPSKQMQKKISNNFKNIIAKEYNKLTPTTKQQRFNNKTT